MVAGSRHPLERSFGVSDVLVTLGVIVLGEGWVATGTRVIVSLPSVSSWRIWAQRLKSKVMSRANGKAAKASAIPNLLSKLCMLSSCFCVGMAGALAAGLPLEF